ncbi:MAG: NAD(P)-dependent oxidoreductase [Dorea sp.]|jgi:nucleoside-diphosphate-sugar epimerase|nr:NAD(P)-dependent oxidoreductase [Dorea sp.]
MNILLVGDDSMIVDAMIDKFNKDDHRIYWLTGRKEKGTSRKRVFEKYLFLYTDGNMKDIIESASPDVILFMGAYDTNFDWRYNGQAEALRYTTSMVNLLSAYSMYGRGRFIYLSSQDVYDSSFANDIPETTPVSPRGFKAPAVSQGEGLCSNYREIQGADTVILRLDNIYNIPRKGQEAGSPCFELCREALRTGRISANSRKKFSMLYLNDAIELIYKVVISDRTAQSCYHISSMEEIDELWLAELIKEKMGAGVTVVDHSSGESRRRVLDGRRYEDEFGQKIFNHYEEGVQKVVQYMKRYSDEFIKDGERGGDLSGRFKHNARVIFKSAIPFIESLVCFIVFFWLDGHTVGSQYFGKLDFFLLYVLLFSIVHGQQQAIFSALLAAIGYWFRQSYDRSGYEVLLDYSTYVWMAQLFIVGMAVGYMRDHLRHVTDDKDEEIRYLYEKIEGIAEINDSNVRIKQNFETQLVNQRDSLGKIYEITSRLEKYAPEEVLFYAAQMLGQLMDSKDVAIYLVANESYARLFSSTSPDARKMGNSIKYDAMGDMYDELRAGRVYVNKEMNDKFPLVASAVYAEGKMQLILMLWGIPWQRMTLAETNRLTIIGTLIQNATVRASRYLENLKNQRYVEGTNVMTKEAFSQLVYAFFEAKKKELTECALLEIQTENQSFEQASAILGDNIRTSDYMGVLKDGKLYVLLSNTDAENAEMVRERFAHSGYESLLREAVV